MYTQWYHLQSSPTLCFFASFLASGVAGAGPLDATGAGGGGAAAAGVGGGGGGAAGSAAAGAAAGAADEAAFALAASRSSSDSARMPMGAPTGATCGEKEYRVPAMWGLSG